MAKNTTRKSLAIGAASALVLAGFSVAPANAAGLADKSFVSLAPTSGTAYTVVSGNGKTFSLTANEATTIAGAGRNMKFLVTDADSKIEPTIATTGRTVAIANDLVVAATDSATSSITIALAGDKLAVGDQFYFDADLNVDGFADADDGLADRDAAAADTIYTVASVVANTSFTFVGGDMSVLDGTDDTGAVDGAVNIKVIREARAADGSYVVDTGSATDASNETLVLAQGNETTTRSVTVTAWVDANGNDTIDATEYTSETRTVTFKKASEITGVVTLTQPTLGDTSLTASVTTTPTLNGAQMSDNDISVKFTRQGSTATLAASATDTVGDGSGTAGKTAWDATNSEWDATAYMILSADNTPWTGLLNANDTVSTGTYTARPYIGSDAIAAAVSAVVGATQADDVKASIAGTANNDAKTNEDGTAATAVVARTASDVVVSATIYDAAGDALGAGVKVTGTLSAETGTINVNGAATSDDEMTDANGQVSFTVSSSTDLATDAATLTIQAQNVSAGAKTAKFTMTWDDATATLEDISVANPASDLNRSTSKNGTVNFLYSITDQWQQPLSGSYRLKVANTGNTVSTTYTTVVGGRASVGVTDSQVGGGSSITTTITVEKDVAGVWTAQDLTNDGNTDGAADTVAYTIGVLDQTDAVTLDADGATVYGSGTADDSDAIAAKATVAQDTRTSNAAVPAYANDVVVTGRVAHATTAAVRAGAVVTVSGTSDMLFTNGGQYSFGSITLVTDSSGEFDVSVYSNKVQTDTVVTVTSNGASATKKVSFTTAGADSGASVSFAGTPAYAEPGATFQVVATLVDAYGNTVDATNNDVRVTYSGPGIVFGTLPTDTDANGQAKFAVLLGSKDTGTATITFEYDTNADGDVKDTGEFSTTYTVTVGSAPADTKVNAGSFKGYVAIYAKGHEGKRLSAKVGNDWVVVPALASNFVRVVEYTGAGYTIAVRIYIDRVLVDTITVTTK